MPDWKANKGAGPWEFVEQPDKLGYVNNPRWVSTPTDAHDPCGYWYREHIPKPTILNVYALVQDYGFWAAYFDGNALTYFGKYVDVNKHFYGPVRYQDSLLVTTGVGSPTPSPTIRQISLLPPFTVKSVYSPFVTHDLTDKVPFQWGPGVVGGKYYILQGSVTGGITPGAYIGSNFVRLNNALQREARGYWATVVTGTDGNLYVSKTFLIPTTGAWASNYRPTTGANWTSAWALIPDNVCDSPITPWGTGTLYSGASSAVSWTYDNGYIYLVSAGQPNIGLRKLDPTTFAIVASNGASANPFDFTLGGHHPVVHGSNVYVIYTTASGAAGYATVKAWSTSTLALQLTSGNFNGQGNIPNCGLIPTTSYLLCWVNTANGQWTLYKLDYNTLNVIASNVINLPSAGATYPPNVMELSLYSEQYCLALYYRGIGVIQLSNLTLTDTIDLIPQGWATNYNLTNILSTETQVALPPVVQSVNPVWPTPQ